MSLSEDITKLNSAPNLGVRKVIAFKISSYLNDDVLKQKEIDIALEIIRILSKDTVVEVRKILAENLKESNIPHDIIMSFASDVEEVSLPILELSKVLTDQDLINIIESVKEVAKLVAISNRKKISNKVSKSLVSRESLEVNKNLLLNEGADIDKEDIIHALTIIKSDASILKELVDSTSLAMGVAEKVISFVVTGAKDDLQNKYNVDENIVKDLADNTYNYFILNLLGSNSNNFNNSVSNNNSFLVKSSEFAKHLYKNKRLNNFILIKSLCIGNLSFFITALSYIVDLPEVSIKSILKDSDNSSGSLKALLLKAGIPEEFIDSLKVIISFAINKEEKNALNIKSFSKEVKDFIINNFYDIDIPMITYLMPMFVNTESVR